MAAKKAMTNVGANVSFDVFGGAAVVTKPTKTPAGKKKDNRVEVEGLEKLAASRSVLKALKTVEATLKDEVNQVMADMFLREGLATGIEPENFKGVEGDGSASCQLKKRSSASALTEVEVELLKQNGITEIDEVSDAVDTFIFNPSVITDQKNMAMISAALGPLMASGALPKDTIQKQVGNKKFVTNDNTITELFKKAKAKADAKKRAEADAMVQTLLPVVATIAARTSYDGDMEKATKAILKELEKAAKEGGE